MSARDEGGAYARIRENLSELGLDAMAAGLPHWMSAVAAGEADRAVVVCTTGIGISIAANKVAGVRCALCGGVWQAEMTRRHNDANMMAIGAGFTGPNMAERMVEVFLSTEFEGGRHARRVEKMMALEG